MTAAASNLGACWIVIPVHNRRETTLRCLSELRSLGVLSWCRIVVVDDGSTDGTSTAVAREFPEIAIERGDGNLWWTGGIVRGMQRAVQENATYIFWLNDDTLPEPGAFEALLRASRETGGIAGGVGYLPGEPTPAYAGYRRGFWKLKAQLQPGANTVACDALNGNLVCLPRAIVEKVGYPDAASLPHGYGDFDYTLRAQRAGIPVSLVGKARAAAHPNLSTNYRSWLLSDVPLAEVWLGLGRRGSFIYQPAMQRFYWRHWGVRGTAYCAFVLAKLAVISVIRPITPRSWREAWRGRHSLAWQHEQRHRQ